MPVITDIAYAKIGQHRGNPRIWFEGRRLRSIGALPGVRYDVIPDESARSLVIVIDECGDRMVSSRVDTPIIDINNAMIAAALGNATRIRAVFTPGRIVVTIAPNEQAEDERLSRILGKLSRGEALAAGSVFHGAGVLDAALHQGMSDVGIKSGLAFAVELDGRFLDTSVRNNPVWNRDGLAITGSVDEIDMAGIPKVEFLAAGIPCTGASLSGRAKLKLAEAESHPTAGHLFVTFLQIVKAAQPGIIVMENVVPYRTTASWLLLKSSLEVMGYQITDTTLDGHALGALESRRRMCAVAVTKGLDIASLDLSNIQAPVVRPATLADVLDPPEVEHRWSRCEGLRAKAVRDKAKVEASGRGTGFQMQILTPDATEVPVITKDYHKWRSTDPKLSGHPTDDQMLRQFSPAEHARIKGIPFALVAGEAPTTQHQMLGQSVCFPAFQAVGRAIGAALHAMRPARHDIIPFPPRRKVAPKARAFPSAVSRQLALAL